MEQIKNFLVKKTTLVLFTILGLTFLSHSLQAQCICDEGKGEVTKIFTEMYNGKPIEFEVTYEKCNGAIVVKSTKMTSSDSTLNITKLGFFGHTTVQNYLYSSFPDNQELRYDGGCVQYIYSNYVGNPYNNIKDTFKDVHINWDYLAPMYGYYRVTTLPCSGGVCCTQTPHTPIIPEEFTENEENCLRSTPPSINPADFDVVKQRPRDFNGLVFYVGSDGYSHWADTVIMDTIKPVSITRVSGCSPACFNESLGFKMTKADMNSDINKVKVYPNPISTVIKLENTAPIIGIDLFNGIGQRMMTFKDSIPTEIKVDNLQKGSYYLRLYSKDGVRVERLVK